MQPTISAFAGLYLSDLLESYRIEIGYENQLI